MPAFVTIVKCLIQTYLGGGAGRGGGGRSGGVMFSQVLKKKVANTCLTDQGKSDLQPLCVRSTLVKR